MVNDIVGKVVRLLLIQLKLNNNIIMTESLKRNLNQSLILPQHPKIIHSISQVGNLATNRSFEIDLGSQNSADSQQVLKMEISQLKRENAFLKGKIQELKKGNIPWKPQILKRQSLNCMNVLKKKFTPTAKEQDSSLNFVLKQIQSVMKSLATLYKIQTNSMPWVLADQIVQQTCQQQTTIQRIDKQYKQKLQRKLQMISFSSEQSRYKSMLEIFGEFYAMKLEEERKIRQRIENYIQKTIQISKTLIEKANYRVLEKSMRSSCIQSVQQESYDFDKFVPSISLNDSFIFKQARFRNQEKHGLSYSTIDAQNTTLD